MIFQNTQQDYTDNMTRIILIPCRPRALDRIIKSVNRFNKMS